MRVKTETITLCLGGHTTEKNYRLRVQPRTAAVNATLPTYAAAAPLLLGARRRSTSPARTALSSKPTARRDGCQMLMLMMLMSMSSLR